MEPCSYYLDQLQRRADRIPQNAFGRAELMAEAAHDAYQATTNELTRRGWNEEEALMVTRLFGQVVKEWIDRGGTSWDALRADLGRRYQLWTNQGDGA